MVTGRVHRPLSTILVMPFGARSEIQMRKLTIEIHEDEVERLNKWLNCLYLSGNLTGYDPAHIFAGMVIQSVLIGRKERTIHAGDLVVDDHRFLMTEAQSAARDLGHVF
jgi:hypothetical protein